MAWRSCFILVQHRFAKPITFKCLAALSPRCGNWHYICCLFYETEVVSVRATNQNGQAKFRLA